MEQFKSQAQHFFSPLTPLWSALVVFFKTSLGLVIAGFILLCLITKFIGGYYHHKYMRGYREFERDMGRREMMQSRYGYDDNIFGNIERQANQMRNIVNDNIHMMDSNMENMINTARPESISADGNQLQKNISRTSVINGKTQGYSLQIQDNMINGNLQGDISDSVTKQLHQQNITVKNGNFSVAYSPELFNTIITILNSAT